MSTSVYCRVRVAAALCILLAETAFASPPTATDDTGITDPGVFEFSVYSTGEFSDSANSYELPVVEIDHGLVDNLSISLSGSRQVLDEDGESSKSGWGEASLGLKWRVYDSEAVKVVLGPSYTTSIDNSSEIRGLVDGINVLSLPVIASYETGDWTFTGQLSYDMTSTSEDGIFYGAWTGYQATDNWLLLAEIYGEELSGADNDGTTNMRLGFEYGVGQSSLAIQFSAGTRLRSELPGDDKLNAEFFLGLSWDTS